MQSLWLRPKDGCGWYNPTRHQYEGDLLLKQGYYNYLYAVVPKGKTKGDITIIDGDHWQTDNDYYIYVYYREKVPEYDRLVGYHKMNPFEERTE